MKLFLAKHDCEEAVVVIAADKDAAVKLFTEAVHAWTDDKWHRLDWPKEFERECGGGLDIPDTEPSVHGTYLSRDGWEMVYRGGEWVRTGHDFFGQGLRDVLEDNERVRKQLAAAAEAESPSKVVT